MTTGIESNVGGLEYQVDVSVLLLLDRLLHGGAGSVVIEPRCGSDAAASYPSDDSGDSDETPGALLYAISAGCREVLQVKGKRHQHWTLGQFTKGVLGKVLEDDPGRASVAELLTRDQSVWLTFATNASVSSDLAALVCGADGDISATRPGSRSAWDDSDLGPIRAASGAVNRVRICQHLARAASQESAKRILREQGVPAHIAESAWQELHDVTWGYLEKGGVVTREWLAEAVERWQCRPPRDKVAFVKPPL